MSFLRSIFESKFAEPRFQPPPVPAQLSTLATPTAAQLAAFSQPSPDALKLLTLQQTPSQYLAALQEKQMGGEMVKTIAHGLPDREGVMWAAQSAAKISDKLPPGEVHALQAAQAWAKNPTAATQAAAAAAAAKTNLQGPGALAAQAAAWAKPAATGAARLTPHAVSAAVLLSAAIVAFPKLAVPKDKVPGVAMPPPVIPPLATPPPATFVSAPLADSTSVPPPLIPPKIQEQTFKTQHPFIAMGLDIAGGKLPVG